GGAVKRRGRFRVSGARGDQRPPELRVGDHQLIAAALRDGQALIEHGPGIGVSVGEVGGEPERARKQAEASPGADLLSKTQSLGKTRARRADVSVFQLEVAD